jgi:hypothetical protein
MALSISSFATSFGITLTNTYGLITNFRLLADRRIELELSIWASPEACGNGLPRVASKIVHIDSDNPAYQQLFQTVASAAYAYLQNDLEGAIDYSGETIYPGSLIANAQP